MYYMQAIVVTEDDVDALSSNSIVVETTQEH